MKLYCGIDLHSNNHWMTVIDEQDKRVYERRLENDIALTLAALEPYRTQLQGVAVESTFNWYWLVDALMAENYQVKLVNTSAVRQYDGLKHSDDRSDAFHLAHLPRLGILPTGYIYPKEQRALRDLLRQRTRLVQQRTMHVLNVKSSYARQKGAVRLLPQAKRFYERKSRQRNKIVAIKALSHKLARACYFILRDGVRFAPERLFTH